MKRLLLLLSFLIIDNVWTMNFDPRDETNDRKELGDTFYDAMLMENRKIADFVENFEEEGKKKVKSKREEQEKINKKNFYDWDDFSLSTQFSLEFSHGISKEIFQEQYSKIPRQENYDFGPLIETLLNGKCSKYYIAINHSETPIKANFEGCYCPTNITYEDVIKRNSNPPKTQGFTLKFLWKLQNFFKEKKCIKWMQLTKDDQENLIKDYFKALYDKNKQFDITVNDFAEAIFNRAEFVLNQKFVGVSKEESEEFKRKFDNIDNDYFFWHSLEEEIQIIIMNKWNMDINTAKKEFNNLGIKALIDIQKHVNQAEDPKNKKEYILTQRDFSGGYRVYVQKDPQAEEKGLRLIFEKDLACKDIANTVNLGTNNDTSKPEESSENLSAKSYIEQKTNNRLWSARVKNFQSYSQFPEQLKRQLSGVGLREKNFQTTFNNCSRIRDLFIEETLKEYFNTSDSYDGKASYEDYEYGVIKILKSFFSPRERELKLIKNLTPKKLSKTPICREVRLQPKTKKQNGKTITGTPKTYMPCELPIDNEPDIKSLTEKKHFDQSDQKSFDASKEEKDFIFFKAEDSRDNTFKGKNLRQYSEMRQKKRNNAKRRKSVKKSLRIASTTNVSPESKRPLSKPMKVSSSAFDMFKETQHSSEKMLKDFRTKLISL